MADLTWPAERLSDALALLLAESKISAARGAGASTPPLERAALNRWLEATLQAQHVESVRGDLRYADVDELLGTRVPLLVRIGDRFLILLGRNRCIDVEQNIRTVARAELRRILCAEAEEGVAEGEESFIERVGVKPRRREAARAAMLRAQIGNRIAELVALDESFAALDPANSNAASTRSRGGRERWCWSRIRERESQRCGTICV